MGDLSLFIIFLIKTGTYNMPLCQRERGINILK